MQKIRTITAVLACLVLAVGCGDDGGDNGDDTSNDIDAPAAIDGPPNPIDGPPIDGAPVDGGTTGVVCGDVTCDPGMDCCVEPGMGGGTSCVAAGTCTGTAFACDDISDCATAGDVCCFGQGGSSCTPGAECETPTCVTEADCPETAPMCCAIATVHVCAPQCPQPP